jgi:phage I-like protein
MTTNIVKFTLINSAHSHLVIDYKHTTTEEAAATKLLGVCIDNHVNWK